jgi:hypothetical protein
MSPKNRSNKTSAASMRYPGAQSIAESTGVDNDQDVTTTGRE